MTDKYHLDDPLPVQYFHYMGEPADRRLRPDLRRPRDRRDHRRRRTRSPLKLALVALAIEAVIGITAGVLTGLRRNGFLDNLVLVSTLFLIAIPTFVTGFVLQFLLGVQLEDHQPDGLRRRAVGRADRARASCSAASRWPTSPG